MPSTSQKSSEPEKYNRSHTALAFRLPHTHRSRPFLMAPPHLSMCIVQGCHDPGSRTPQGQERASLSCQSIFFSNGVLGASLCQALCSKCCQPRRSGGDGITGKFSLRVARPGSLQVAVRIPSSPCAGPGPGCSPPARPAPCAKSWGRCPDELLFEALVAMGTAARASVVRNSRSRDPTNGQQAP